MSTIKMISMSKETFDKLESELAKARQLHDEGLGIWEAENQQLKQQLAKARADAERYRAALEKIAKPALGGKQQQWIAAEALGGK